MSTLILPTAKAAATRVNPRISVFYGPPKIGKTTKLAELESCLILDGEKGADTVESMRVPVNSTTGPTIHNPDGSTAFTSVDAVIAGIEAIGMAEFEKTQKMPKPPYKYLAVDTIDKLEEFCEVSATAKYKASTIGKNFTGKSVLELPDGGGYYHLRNEVVEYIDRLAMVCEHLILISHVRDKKLDKGGVAVEVKDIALAGKLAKIVCAKADVIGFVYRTPGNKDLMVSFETYEDSTMGARFPRLAGQKMPFDWSKIFLTEDSKSNA